MNYRTSLLALFIFGIGINYYFDTRNITYDFSVEAAILGAIAYQAGALAIPVVVILLWGTWAFIRDRKLPDRFIDKFFVFAFWVLSALLVSRALDGIIINPAIQ